MSVAKQSYQTGVAAISDGLSVSQVAQKVRVSRQTLHSWLAVQSRGLASRPHQMRAAVDAAH